MNRSYTSALGAALVAAALLTPDARTEEPRPRESPRIYGNHDLDRVHAQREEVGFASVPAVTEKEAGPSSGATAKPKSGEEFWRREAETHRARLAALQRTLAELQDKAAAARRAATGQSRKNAANPAPSFERRIAAVEARIHDEEMRFLDRARREGALPGWLR